jgi:DNA-binding transcriptional ArsR family regulator
MTTNGRTAEAAWLAAFGEPTRLGIIHTLAAGAKTVTELAKANEVEIVEASRHLGVLKDHGLITADRDGRFRVYALVGATVNGTTLTLTHTSGVQVVIPLD